MARNPISLFRPGSIMERGGYCDPFLSLHREMNRLFDDALRGSFGGSGQGLAGGAMPTVMPSMDVSETDKEVRIVAELPGVAAGDVDVTLNDDVLTVRGEKRSERKEDGKENYHVVERSFGSFQRSVRLPFAVDPDSIKADFEHGVLTVTLPKGKEQERTRRIPVSAAGQARAEMASGARAKGADQQGAGAQGQSDSPAGRASQQAKPDTMQGSQASPSHA